MVDTKCLVYSRVVGYIRPIENWHDGKQAEFKDRRLYNVESNEKEKDSEQDNQTSL